MLQEITLTPATVVIVLAVLVWAAWAVRRLVGRGMCDCGDKCGGCSRKGAVGGKGAKSDKGGTPCSHCGAARDMVARMEASLD